MDGWGDVTEELPGYRTETECVKLRVREEEKAEFFCMLLGEAVRKCGVQLPDDWDNSKHDWMRKGYVFCIGHEALTLRYVGNEIDVTRLDQLLGSVQSSQRLLRRMRRRRRDDCPRRRGMSYMKTWCCAVC